MDDILYLVHATNKYKENWVQLEPSNIKNFDDQFPGVFFSLITKDNIDYEEIIHGKYILIFSKTLLEQSNYHINLRDYNGYISENNTYFPWDLHTVVRKIKDNKKLNSNEVVFHDPIPMEYLCTVIKKISPFVSPNDLLPRISLFSENEPDMSKKPFYCYPLEKNYTGIDPLPESSRNFFVKMAKLCNVDCNLETDEIIEKIKTKIPKIYKNRKEQNMYVLKKRNSRKTLKIKK